MLFSIYLQWYFLFRLYQWTTISSLVFNNCEVSLLYFLPMQINLLFLVTIETTCGQIVLVGYISIAAFVFFVFLVGFFFKPILFRLLLFFELEPFVAL